MILSNNEIKRKYLQILEEIRKDEFFIEFVDMLNKYNFSLKIEHGITYQKLEDSLNIDDKFWDQTILCYLHENICYDEVQWRKKIKNSDIALSAKERAEKFYELSQKLIFLYRKGLFAKLEKEIFDTQDIMEIKWAKGNLISDDEVLEMIGGGPFGWPEIIYNHIVFSIDGINIFNLGGNRYFTKDDIEYFIEEVSNKEYFINRVRSNTDIYNITEFEWFSNLSDKSKNLVDSGNQYLDLVYTQTTDLKDYSPLLLNFSKVLEVEIKEYYNKHFSLIWPLADLVNVNSKLLRKKFSGDNYKIKRINELIRYCKAFSFHKEGYNPSGHKPLPYILYYLGLGKELEEIIDIKGFLEGEERETVQKETSVIDRLFYTSNKRNKYVHELVIESRHEFAIYYTDIIQALSLLASLK